MSTASPSTIDPTAAEHFAAHGYAKLEGYFDALDVARIARGVSALEGDRTLIEVPEADRPGLLCRVEDFLSRASDLGAFVEERLTPAVAALLGEDAVVFKEKINLKRPGGGAFRPHQDHPAFTAFPAHYHLTAMVSLDASDEQTGCLQFAQRYRRVTDVLAAPDARYTPAGYPVLAQNEAGDIRDDLQDRFDWRHEPTTTSDLILFDAFVPHRSEPNRSVTRSRRALFVTYNPRSQGEHRAAYYRMKRADPHNPLFHVGTPTRGADPGDRR